LFRLHYILLLLKTFIPSPNKLFSTKIFMRKTQLQRKRTWKISKLNCFLEISLYKKMNDKNDTILINIAKKYKIWVWETTDNKSMDNRGTIFILLTKQWVNISAKWQNFSFRKQHYALLCPFWLNKILCYNYSLFTFKFSIPLTRKCTPCGPFGEFE